MPQIKVTEDQAHEADSPLYGIGETDNSVKVQEHLIKMFAPHETVQVMNIDDEPIKWQYQPAYNERYGVSDDGTKDVSRGLPELWEIPAGEMDVLIGENAYLMMDTLYKRLVVKKAGGTVARPQDEREIKNFSWNDPLKMQQILEKVFMGKITPSQMTEAAAQKLNSIPNEKPKSSRS